MKKTVLTLSALAFIGAVTFTSCKKDSESSTTTPVTPSPSLYEQVGGTKLVVDSATAGKPMIEAGRLKLRQVTASAITVIAADSKMDKFFPMLHAELSATPANYTGYNLLLKNFTEFLCYATGSKTIAYGGKSMKDAHNIDVNARMGQSATAADFDNFITDVATALNQNGVATGTKLFNDLAALLGTTKGDIVQNLYTRVGGTELVDDPDSKTTPKAKIEKGRLTLRTVTNSALNIIAADSRMTKFFPRLLAEVSSTPSNTTGFNALSKNFTDFLCTATGSANTTYAYTGLDMHKAHNFTQNSRFGSSTVQTATGADFDIFIEDVGKALNNNGVATGTRLYNDLAGALNGLKTTVVQ